MYHNQVHHADVIKEDSEEHSMQADVINEDSEEHSMQEGDECVSMAARKGPLTFTSLGSLLDSSRSPGEKDSANRRLLLDCKNPLHVINGTHSRYFMGIIDFFTQYKCKQQVARVLKVCKNCTGDHSTVPPDIYADRFLRFIEERTE